MSPSPYTDETLQAWLDGELPPDVAGQVAAYVDSHPETAERVTAWQRQRLQLQALHAAVLDEPVPARLQALAHDPARQPWARRAGLRRAAAAAALFAVGLGAGWALRAASMPAVDELARAAPVRELARDAALAHAVYAPDLRRPVEIGADQEAQLVKWLTKRLGQPVQPPTLAALGWTLMGGRLVPGGEGPVAQLMYEDPQGRRITVCISPRLPQAQSARFQFSQEGPLSVFYWVAGSAGYAVAGPLSRDALVQVAEAVYAQQGKDETASRP